MGGQGQKKKNEKPTKAGEIRLPLGGPTVDEFFSISASDLEQWANRFLPNVYKLDNGHVSEISLKLNDFAILVARQTNRRFSRKVQSFSYQAMLGQHTGQLDRMVRDYQNLLSLGVKFALLSEILAKVNLVFWLRYART